VVFVDPLGTEAGAAGAADEAGAAREVDVAALAFHQIIPVIRHEADVLEIEAETVGAVAAFHPIIPVSLQEMVYVDALGTEEEAAGVTAGTAEQAIV